MIICSDTIVSVSRFAAVFSGHESALLYIPFCKSILSPMRLSSLTLFLPSLLVDATPFITPSTPNFSKISLANWFLLHFVSLPGAILNIKNLSISSVVLTVVKDGQNAAECGRIVCASIPKAGTDR